MSRKPKRQPRHPDWENTCNYCLYLQPDPSNARSGNCTYHRQWIQRCAYSTCSDMSAQPLEDGIYTLTSSAYGEWTYHRRRDPVRPRLFLVQGRARDKQPRHRESETRTKKRMT